MACAMMAPCGARAARAQCAAQARAGARPPRRARVVAMATRRSAREHVVLVSTLVPKEGHEAELRELCDGVVQVTLVLDTKVAYTIVVSNLQR